MKLFVRYRNKSLTFCFFSRHFSNLPQKGPLPSKFDPKFVEADWGNFWAENSALRSSSGSKKNFVICLPPPNVTGNLHLGHALTISVQDSLARWNRMRGQRVFFIPGIDHAGIATQMVVEKILAKKGQKTRQQMTRAEFFEECQKWKEKKFVEIKNQIHDLGADMNWDRFYYTLDENFSRIVK